MNRFAGCSTFAIGVDSSDRICCSVSPLSRSQMTAPSAKKPLQFSFDPNPPKPCQTFTVAYNLASWLSPKDYRVRVFPRSKDEKGGGIDYNNPLPSGTITFEIKENTPHPIEDEPWLLAWHGRAQRGYVVHLESRCLCGLMWCRTSEYIPNFGGSWLVHMPCLRVARITTTLCQICPHFDCPYGRASHCAIRRFGCRLKKMLNNAIAHHMSVVYLSFLPFVVAL